MIRFHPQNGSCPGFNRITSMMRMQQINADPACPVGSHRGLTGQWRFGVRIRGSVVRVGVPEIESSSQGSNTPG
jgi:hypothetical protein